MICEKKVLQNGCKYPQNSSTSLFSLHFITLSVKWPISSQRLISFTKTFEFFTYFFTISSNFLMIFDSISLNKVLQNGCKCPQNSFIELICGHTNAYCWVLCFKSLDFLAISSKWPISPQRPISFKKCSSFFTYFVSIPVRQFGKVVVKPSHRNIVSYIAYYLRLFNTTLTLITQ